MVNMGIKENLKDLADKAAIDGVTIDMQEGLLLAEFFELHSFVLDRKWAIVYPFNIKLPIVAETKDDLFEKFIAAAFELKKIRKEIDPKGLVDASPLGDFIK